MSHFLEDASHGPQIGTQAQEGCSHAAQAPAPGTPASAAPPADRAELPITTQPAVSPEDSPLHHELQELVRELTGALAAARQEAASAARQACMATNVLHNVGNVLNSVNISADLARARLRHSKTPRLLMAVRLLKEHAGGLADFLSADERGRLLPDYLERLAESLVEEQGDVAEELAQLTRCIDHMKDLVTAQQRYATAGSLVEQVELRELVEDAVRINRDGLARQQASVVQRYHGATAMHLDKGRVLQILVNLIANAGQALREAPAESRVIEILADRQGGRLRIRVADRGVGINLDHLEKIFTHGFTTRKDGHGFGLHSCAVAAREMGGSLSVESAGAGKGATFTLDLPLNDAGETT